MSDDEATRPVPQPAAADPAGSAGSPEGTGDQAGGSAGAPARTRWLWVAIGVLALVIAALLVLLLLRPAATPAAEATATPTPTPSAVPSSAPPAEPAPEATTEPEPPSAPVFTSFSAEPAIADCSGGAASVPLVFSWSSEGATEAWIGVGTADAQAEPYEAVPTSASGYANLAFQCSEASQVYTVTISGPTGVAHSSVTIVRA